MSSRPLKKLPSKGSRNTPAPSLRTPLYRQVKIIASIETDDMQDIKSESDVDGPESSQAASTSDICKERITSPSTTNGETLGNVASHGTGNAEEDTLPDGDSEYVPLEEEDPASEDPPSDQDSDGHRTKRCKTNNILPDEDMRILAFVVVPEVELEPRGNSPNEAPRSQVAALLIKDKQGETVGQIHGEDCQQILSSAQASLSRTTPSIQGLVLSVTEKGSETIEADNAWRRAQEGPRTQASSTETAPRDEPVSFSLNDRGETVIEPVSYALKRSWATAFSPSPSRPARTTQSYRFVARHNPGEDSSRNAAPQMSLPVQYLHTLTRTNLRAGPPGVRDFRGPQMNPAACLRVDNRNVNNGNQHHLHSSDTTRYSASAIRGMLLNNSRDFSRVFVQLPLGPLPASLPPPAGWAPMRLVDCRNEQNGLDGRRSNGKDKELQPSHKCHVCFKFRRNCDGAKASCNCCSKVNGKCVWPNILMPPPREEPIAPVFSSSQLWGKCQSCAGLERQCAFDDDQDDCQNCKKRGWKCRPLAGPKPKKKNEYRGRNQDPKTKCFHCVKARSHCDGAKPRCGHCKRWKYRCFPPGTAPPKKIANDDKCKRCRQLKLACCETLPCPRCVKEEIPCGMTAKEEEMQTKFLGD
jgi:hypothetical protein